MDTDGALIIKDSPAARRPRRPLVYIIAAYISGIAFCFFFAPERTPLIAGLAACASAALLTFVNKAAPGIPAYAPFVLLLAAVFFTGSVYAHVAFSRVDPLESRMSDGEGYAEGVIGHVLFAEQRAPEYRQLTVWADGRKLLVRVFGERGQAMRPAIEDIIGKRVSLTGMLSYPDTARNPRCFDYRLYLMSIDIRLVMTCEPQDEVIVIEDGNAGLQWHALSMFARAKAAFTERVGAVLSPGDAALFAGMLFGDKRDMDEETYDLFRRNGIAHILSVSGLHVGMVYAFVSVALGRRKTKRFYAIVLVLLICYAALASFSPPVMRAVTMIAVHIAAKLLTQRYDMLTGVLLSAFIMLLFNPLALFGLGFLLSYAAVCSLSFALPLVDRYTGFRSKLTRRPVKAGELVEFYGATSADILGGRALKLIIPAALIQLFVLPLTMYYFNCLPLLAVLANIPVIAIASLIIPFGLVVLLASAAGAALPGLAFVLEPAAEIGATSSGVLLDVMLLFTRAVDQVPGSSPTVPSPPIPVVMLLYFGAFFLLSDSFAMNFTRSRINFKGAVLPAIIALSCLLAFAMPTTKQNDATYTFVDVGQGDCLHVRTADGRNYLMDGGGKYEYDVGKNILMPYLLKNGVSRLDGVFVSHLHMDHFKGISELAGYMDVGPVYVYDGYRMNEDAVTNAFWTNPFDSGNGGGDEGNGLAGDGSGHEGNGLAGDGSGHDERNDAGYEGGSKDGGITPEDIRYLAAGDVVLLGKYTCAEALFPPRLTENEYEQTMAGDADENRTSLIIRFETEGVSVLMTGDLSMDGERAALGLSDLSCDILKIGHHGSKTSTSEDLLEKADPFVVVIQVGKNSFGHPTAEVLEKLETFGLPTYRNDESGAVMIHPRSGGFIVQTVRRDFVSPMLLKPYEKGLFGIDR